MRMTLPREQFESLALEQIDALYRMARRLTHDGNKADDLVQDTFARALRSRNSFQLADYGIKPWLLRIMYNLHLNRAERDKLQPVATADAALEHSGTSDETALPIDPSSFQAMDQQLVHALDELPEDYRTVMLLWAVEELSYKEISDALEIPMGTVMSRLYRARQQLAARLKVYATEEGIIRE